MGCKDDKLILFFACTRQLKDGAPLCKIYGSRLNSEQSVPGMQQFSGSNRNCCDPGTYFWGGVRSREKRRARLIFKNAIAARQCIYF